MRLTEQPGERRLETTTTARFLGMTVAHSTTTTTLESTTGITKEYRSLSKKRGRHFSFGKESYTVARLYPSKDRDAEEPWQIAYQHEFPNPPPDEKGVTPLLFDYYGMLLHLRHAGLESPGDEATLFVATSSGAEPYLVRVTDSRTSERAFTNLATGQVTTLSVDELRLTIAPEDPETEEGFMKMKGETEIWVESETKTPIEIGGRIPKIGKVRLVLSAMG